MGLLIGVSITANLVLWGWATSISLSSFTWEKTPKKLVEKANRLDALFNNEKETDKNEQMKLQIKIFLNTIATELIVQRYFHHKYYH